MSLPEVPAITPLPVPPGTRRVLLYGGVFDPPHRAHVELPAAARRWLGPEVWLVYVPAARSPMKGDGPAAPEANRVAMLERAIGLTPERDSGERGVVAGLLVTSAGGRTAIWTDELDRAASEGTPSYWIDTVQRARQMLGPDAEVCFLIGADQAAQFHKWREFRRILTLARPVVMLRPPIETPEALREALRGARNENGERVWSEEDIGMWVGAVAPLPVRDDNSTVLRELLMRMHVEPEARAQAEAMVPSVVLDYIVREGLYRGA